MNKPKPKRTARLSHNRRILTITDKKKSTTYIVEKIPIDKKVGREAFALTKEDGTVYHVTKGPFGVACDCADATYRNRKCRHLLALMVVGLITGASYGYHENADQEKAT